MKLTKKSTKLFNVKEKKMH